MLYSVLYMCPVSIARIWPCAQTLLHIVAHTHSLQVEKINVPIVRMQEVIVRLFSQLKGEFCKELFYGSDLSLDVFRVKLLWKVHSFCSHTNDFVDDFVLGCSFRTACTFHPSMLCVGKVQCRFVHAGAPTYIRHEGAYITPQVVK